MIKVTILTRFTVILLALCSAQAVYSAERFALVIGNSQYDEISKLVNPVNDARAVAARLDAFGFKRLDINGQETSAVLENLDRRSFLKAVNNFERTIRSAGEVEIVFVYYAGHGMQRAGRPYLLPIDVPADDVDLAFEESVELNSLLSRLDGIGNLTVAVFDACREIPQLDGMAKRSGYGGATAEFRGLARVSSNGRSRLVAYAGAAGELVADGSGQHSPYTQTLLTAMKTPGRPVEELFQDTAYRFNQTFGGQSPEVLLQGVEPRRFYFTQPAVVVPTQNYAQQESSMGLTREEKRSVQKALGASGITVGVADGIWGSRTREGIKTWQERMGFTVTGYLDERSYKELVAELVLTEQVVPDVPPGPLRRAFEPKMVRITEGSFEMGSLSGDEDERPVRSVSVERFELGETEVSVAQWRAFTEDSGYVTEAERDVGAEGCYSETAEAGKFDWVASRSWKFPGFVQEESHPVVCVSWNDVQEYIEWLNQRTSGGYRLPTEAEWEYATRAGSNSEYHFGNSETELCRYGNVADQSHAERYKGWTIAGCTDGHIFTSPVASFQPNPNGAYDLHGNVWEWTEDCWHYNYEGAPLDASAWLEEGDCGRRVLRGGSWSSSPGMLRSANRDRDTTSGRSNYTGFRLSRTLTP